MVPFVFQFFTKLIFLEFWFLADPWQLKGKLERDQLYHTLFYFLTFICHSLFEKAIRCILFSLSITSGVRVFHCTKNLAA